MSQNDSDTTNILSSSKEVEFSTRMIPMVERLIQQQVCLVKQQERIISLIEAIAPKKEELDNEDFASTGSREWAYASAEEQLSDDERLRILELYGAAQNGDWKTARRIYDENGGKDFGVEISRKKDTALHIAAAANRIVFVKELLKLMNENDFQKKNENGETAFFCAAMSGKVKIAKEMIKKSKEIAMVRDNFGKLPIQMAAELGHKDMVEYLYQETKDSLNEDDRKNLFVKSIETDLFDFALELFEDYPDLATARATNEETVLHVLARKDLGAKSVEKKTPQALELVKLIWEKVRLLSHKEISELIPTPRKLIFDAAKRGNSLLLSKFIRKYPDLIWKVDNRKNNYTIFHYAVKYRQEDVFNLIYEIGSSKEILLRSEDDEGNNILHLASMLAPLDRLNIAPGPAMQMRQELIWFQKVKNVVHPSSAEARNKDGRTPRELFTEMHKDLKDKAEKWMTKTAGSSMVVAALIATVAFAAAITVPGGNNQNTGFPIFYAKVSFIIFALSDATSLIFSAASLVFFLFIPTLSYAEENFLELLPVMLTRGLNGLFVSMAAMMVVFSSTFFIFFTETRSWIAILVTSYASVPVIYFLLLHLIVPRKIRFGGRKRQSYRDPMVSFFSSLFFQKVFGGPKWQSDDQSHMAKKLSGRLGTCSTNV